MAVEDGGPAFPSIQLDDRGESIVPAQQGMTLRDYFAGQYVAGRRVAFEDFEDDAEIAYQFADAMIAARAKGGDQ